MNNTPFEMTRLVIGTDYRQKFSTLYTRYVPDFILNTYFFLYIVMCIWYRKFLLVIICFFLFKKNLVFQIFIKKRIDKYIEKILNDNGQNARHYSTDAMRMLCFMKKKPFLKNARERKLTHIAIHQSIMNDLFL